MDHVIQPKEFEEAQSAAERAATELGVSPALHPQDYLLHFILENKGVEAGAKGYIRGGRSDANTTIGALKRLRVPLDEPVSVLEFAAGFGRVTRHLKACLPPTCRLVASDIHPEACAFIANELGVDVLQSSQDPADLSIPERFRAIVVLSLFSHLPDHSFGRWLHALYGLLEPGGTLLFTTHGEFCLENRPAFFVPFYDERRGWGFKQGGEQQDLDSESYGRMIVSPRYVLEQIGKLQPEAKLRSFLSGTWFGLQDEWAISRPA